jgi:hypothetical protein
VVALASGSAGRRADASTHHSPASPALATPTADAPLTEGVLGWSSEPGPVGSTEPTTPGEVGLPGPANPVSAGLAADGIPAIALDAYQRAAARTAGSEPACGLRWPLLAAIGRVESDHGRFSGAVLHVDGTSTPKIIGIPLDGVGAALITDSDGGRLDGDTVLDRAVGPMQFIPTTWANYAADGDGDGVTDPFSIYDAALAAAHYLCAAGGDLRTTAGQTRAVLAYNHSDSYLALVLALNATYSGETPVPTGPLPDVPPIPAKVPPVDPGPPLGLQHGSGSRAVPSAKSSGASGSGSRPVPSSVPAPSLTPTPTVTPTTPTPTPSGTASSTCPTSSTPGSTPPSTTASVTSVSDANTSTTGSATQSVTAPSAAVPTQTSSGASPTPTRPTCPGG